MAIPVVIPFIREFKKLRLLLQRKGHLKIKLYVRLNVLRFSMVVTLYKIGEVYFRVLGTNGFHVKQRMKDLFPRCRQNLKYENFTSSFVDLMNKNKSFARTSRAFFVSVHFFSFSANLRRKTAISQVL